MLRIAGESSQAAFSVEIADDAIEQIAGLMFRDALPERTGMLFVYEKDRVVQFWMKNVSFPVDMIFINRCGRITHIHENAQPDTTSLIGSSGPVRAVLELNGGASKRAQIRPGDTVELTEDKAVFDPC